MTIKEAENQFGPLLEKTLTSEKEACALQEKLGDACKELRLAYEVPMNVLAQRLGADCWGVSKYEQRSSSSMAQKYRSAVLAAAGPPRSG